MRFAFVITLALASMSCALFSLGAIPCDADDNCPTGRFCDLGASPSVCLAGERPPDACAADQHDGGDGTCVDIGQCLAGFTLEDSGRCGRWVEVVESLALGGLRIWREYDLVALDGTSVLVYGGFTDPADFRRDAYVVDVADGTVDAVGLAPFPQELAAAARLLDGRVLIAGGFLSLNERSDRATIFDPVTRSFDTVASMPTPRASHTATLLDDGRVFVAGSDNDSDRSTALYDPANDTWAPGPDQRFNRARHVVAKLQDGRVVILAGNGRDAERGPDFYRSVLVEVFDPADDSLTSVGEHRVTGLFSEATVLNDGRVFLRDVDEIDIIRIDDFELVTRTAPENGGLRFSTTLEDGTVYRFSGGSFGDEPVELVGQSYDPVNDTFGSAVASPGTLTDTFTVLDDGTLVLGTIPAIFRFDHGR